MSSMFWSDKSRRISFFIFLTILVVPKSYAQNCTYQSWDWSTVEKKSVNHQKIVKPKSDLTAVERGTVTNCSVCEEDQTEVSIIGLPTFKVCRDYKEKIVRALSAAKAAGFLFRSIVAYRVGKSKGSIDASGLRTQFSNHSYGTAIDFNSELNGLYDDCPEFGPNCKLLRGGKYRRDDQGAITETSAIYKSMIEAGFKWGGEIKGKQKDFMHFSLTGM